MVERSISRINMLFKTIIPAKMTMKKMEAVEVIQAVVMRMKKLLKSEKR